MLLKIRTDGPVEQFILIFIIIIPDIALLTSVESISSLAMGNISVITPPVRIYG